jgi:hypothetical protein
LLHSRLGELLGLLLPGRTLKISRGYGGGFLARLASEPERDLLTGVSNRREEEARLRIACMDITDRFRPPPAEELRVGLMLARGGN